MAILILETAIRRFISDNTQFLQVYYGEFINGSAT